MCAAGSLRPSSRVMVAVLVDCPHEPQFLPNLDVAQSASVVAGRVTHQSRPFAQSGDILGRAGTRGCS